MNSSHPITFLVRRPMGLGQPRRDGARGTRDIAPGPDGTVNPQVAGGQIVLRRGYWGICGRGNSVFVTRLHVAGIQGAGRHPNWIISHQPRDRQRNGKHTTQSAQFPAPKRGVGEIAVGWNTCDGGLFTTRINNIPDDESKFYSP